MTETYSQIGQDSYLINKIYKNKIGGYFVDVGAYDGINFSNTYLLEKKYKWRGICIEPLPEIFRQLQKVRSAICLNTAAFSKSGDKLKFVSADMYSGILSYIDRYHNVLNGQPVIEITTKTLTEILDENGAPRFIEYLSIDTEGSEFEILKGINFDKYKFGYISIEHNFVEPRRTQMRLYLQTKGYLFHRTNIHDDDFISPDILIS